MWRHRGPYRQGQRLPGPRPSAARRRCGRRRRPGPGRRRTRRGPSPRPSTPRGGGGRTSGAGSPRPARSAVCSRPPIRSLASSTTHSVPGVGEGVRDRQARDPGADHDHALDRPGYPAGNVRPPVIEALGRHCHHPAQANAYRARYCRALVWMRNVRRCRSSSVTWPPGSGWPALPGTPADRAPIPVEQMPGDQAKVVAAPVTPRAATFLASPRPSGRARRARALAVGAWAVLASLRR